MDTEVLVVGAGPTGLMLATELALAGTSVAVVERDAAPSPQSRGGGVNARTAEVLAMRGLLGAIESHAIPRDGAGAHFAGLPVPLDARPWRTRHPDGVLVAQNRLSAVLEARLAECGVAVRRRAALTGVAQDEGGVTAVLADGDSVRAGFLVACDGGHSAVRKLIGAAFPGRSGTMSAVTADIDLAAMSDTVARSATHFHALQRSGGGYWMLLHPLDGEAGSVDGYRVVFGGPGPSKVPREAPVTPDEVARALAAVHGPQTVLGRLRWGTRFSDAFRQLAAYRHGRILFAGDAAHIHLPVGGQGLDLGLQDAVNLGWKLAATVAGDAPDGLLDTYHAERHPVAARVLATVRAQAVIMNPGPEADDVRALREVVADLARLPDANRHLAGLMSGLSLRYDLGDPDPLVGTRMIDLSLRAPDGPTSVGELLRRGRGLLLDLHGPGDGPRAAPRNGGDATGGGAVDHVAAEVLDSPVGTDLPARRILVRPDGYVCWASDDPAASPEPALRRWFAAAPAAHNA
jgi:2-polyprenyl-6-methoxyphenol hydroxylase-like FAD-dependent oxidoreductase